MDSSDVLPDKPAHNGRGKVQLLTLSDLDGRTNAAKRAHQLVAELEKDLQPDVPIEQHLRIVDLAVLTAMTNDMAAKYFSGEAVDRVAFATLTNAKRRILDSLS